MARHLENDGASLSLAAVLHADFALDIEMLQTETPRDRLDACWTFSPRNRRISLHACTDLELFQRGLSLGGKIVGLIQNINSNRPGFS